MPVSQLSFTYTYTDSTSTNYLSRYEPSSTIEKIHHWLNCLDQPQIRKPYLPSQITSYESNHKKPTIFKPFLGNKFKVGNSMT